MDLGTLGRRASGWTKGVSNLQRLHSVVRPQLGSSLPAIALPMKPGSEPEHVLLFFGIIDFLQVGLPPVIAACVMALLLLHVGRAACMQHASLLSAHNRHS